VACSQAAISKRFELGDCGLAHFLCLSELFCVMSYDIAGRHMTLRDVLICIKIKSTEMAALSKQFELCVYNSLHCLSLFELLSKNIIQVVIAWRHVMLPHFMSHVTSCHVISHVIWSLIIQHVLRPFYAQWAGHPGSGLTAVSGVACPQGAISKRFELGDRGWAHFLCLSELFQVMSRDILICIKIKTTEMAAISKRFELGVCNFLHSLSLFKLILKNILQVVIAWRHVMSCQDSSWKFSSWQFSSWKISSWKILALADFHWKWEDVWKKLEKTKKMAPTRAS
jgi:hypothetical protein